MKVEKGDRKEDTSRCLVPEAGLRIWIPPHWGRKKELCRGVDSVDSRRRGRIDGCGM